MSSVRAHVIPSWLPPSGEMMAAVSREVYVRMAKPETEGEAVDGPRASEGQRDKIGSKKTHQSTTAAEH